MWTLKNLGTSEDQGLIQTLESYILEKNLNFIVAQGQVYNQTASDLGRETTMDLIRDFACCDLSLVSLLNQNPSPPFIAAQIDTAAPMARVWFIIDLTREADAGQASPFYSKVLGAFATQFFSSQPNMKQLWFPFTLEDTLGRGLAKAPMDRGTAVFLK